MSERKQTYLVGPTLSLRAVEESDAASEPSWRQSWFPRARAVSEAKIEEDYADGDTTLVAVRTSDDVIVGSVLIWFDGPWAFVLPYAARWLTAEDAEAVMAEIVSLTLPFLVDEGGIIAALAQFPSGLPGIVDALEQIGARFCYRHREGMMYRGKRHDWLAYQYFNKKTLAVFGEPTFTPEAPAEREVTNPAPTHWPVVETPPPGAVMIGERVYLRMFTPEDGEILREASLTDTEFSHVRVFPAAP